MPPAIEEKRLNAPQLRGTLGIIAGSGDLPRRLLAACERRGIDVFIVGFPGHTDADIFENRAHILTRPGAAGQILDALRAHNVHDLVLIGAVRRPSLAELRPDLRAARFFARIGMRALGDDGLLRALKNELQEEGFAIHAIQDFTDDAFAPPGPLGTIDAGADFADDIARGVAVAHMIGQMDIGQSVVMQQGIVLGVEGIEGTDELIKRCAAYARAGRGPVLVKCCKPSQDKMVDLPTIGPDTIMRCAEHSYAGVVVEAGATLIVGREEIARLADHHKIFVTAVDTEKLARDA